MMCKLPPEVEITGPDTKESVDSAIESSAKNARNLYIILMETPLRERDTLLNGVGENPWINLDGGEYSSRELLPTIKDGCQESTILIENIADYGNYLRGLTGIPIWQIGPFIRFTGLRESAGTGVASATYGSYAPAFISGIATNPNYNWRAPRNLLAFAVNPYDSKGRMFGRGLVERYKESPAQSLQDLLKPDLSSGLYVNEKGDLEPINKSPAYEDPLFTK
ncbi:MAG: hypothetical protein M1165_01625 [Candidatus Pacearchaeota archaeon]|nr:hypothetical protein [Candidatus Pacearchaeota archaeon]